MLTLVALRVLHVGDNAGDRRRAQAAQRGHARHYTVVRDPIVPLRWIQVCSNVSNVLLHRSLTRYYSVLFQDSVRSKRLKIELNRTESHSPILDF